MNENSSLRLAMVGMLLLGMFIALFSRLWFLQVVTENREAAQSRAAESLYRSVLIPAPRGRVLDRNGNVLIDNRLVNEVTIERFSLQEVFPDESDQEAFAIKLAREISAAGRLIKAKDVLAALDAKRYGDFDRVPIATDVPERFSILIGEREDEFPGVRVRKTTQRFYPYGTVASHLLGYVGSISAPELERLRNSPKLYKPTDELGKSGVEASFEDVLRGTPGVEVIEVDALGNRIRTVSSEDPVPGNDVVLTIDVNLQALVEQELARGIRDARTRNDVAIRDGEAIELEAFEAPGGAAVLLDPDGALILALASYPNYDQRIFLQEVISERTFNLLNLDPAAPLLNRATNAKYAPGSTFKVIAAYAALDSGLLGDRGFLRREQFLEDKGVWSVKDCFGVGCTIANAGGGKKLGDVDLEIAITKSSNVYFGQLGFQFNVRAGFSSDQMLDIARDFGFGELTDAIPGSYAGALPSPESAGESANMAVGQGRLEATPLQLANSYAVIANRGNLYSPMLAEKTLDAATGEVLIEYQPRLLRTLYMPDEFYNPIIRGMAGVVTEEGTAGRAFLDFPLDRFQVLGKTGTVETNKQDNAVFAAFGPWPNPRYSVVAYLENAGNGGDSAAPVVARILEQIANGNIAVVPTVAESDELKSVAQLEEEERIAALRDLDRDSELQALESESEGFQVLVPSQQPNPDANSPEGENGGETDAQALIAPDANAAEDPASQDVVDNSLLEVNPTSLPLGSQGASNEAAPNTQPLAQPTTAPLTGPFAGPPTGATTQPLAPQNLDPQSSQTTPPATTELSPAVPQPTSESTQGG